MNILYKIIIYLSSLIILLIISKIISYVSQPIIKDTNPEFDNFSDYMKAIYNSSLPKILIDYNDSFSSSSIENDTNINILNTLYYYNFIYDNAPRTILDLYPMADNLSFTWPPRMGSRYKLTAFPYPKSTFILSAVYETISNTVDTYTFPGWSIQRRNPLDFNNSIYNNGFFRDYQDIEVLHACYPPPGAKYPLCDDGGWWLYYAAGSGVFWNTGKCLVSLNKLSLLNDLYNCTVKTRREIIELNKLRSISKQLTVPPVLGLSIADMAQRFEGKGGGKSIMVAIFTIVESLTKHNFKGGMIGFKNLTPSNSGHMAWTKFITHTFFILYLIAFTIIMYFTNIRGKSWKIIILLSIVCLILFASFIYYFLFVVFEDFFRGLGWMTLDMALTQTGMNTYEFVSECVTGNLKMPICNSLAMIQLFDLDIEAYTYAMGYDSFILTSQPNKTGLWEVEICDLRRYDPKKKGIAMDGGVCNTLNIPENNILVQSSNPEDRFNICENKLLPKLNPNNSYYKLMSGPLIYDKTGPPYYKPTQQCECIEDENRLCTSCKGTLSGKLCINK